MQRILALALVTLVMSGLRGPAVAGTLEVYNPPTPPTVVPAVRTLVQAVDLATGQVAFSQMVDGQVQSATLSDSGEAAFSVARIGSSIFRPQTMLFVQPIGGAPGPNVLTTEGPMWNLGISESRLAWSDNESIKVRMRASGDTTSYGNAYSTNVQISGNRLLWHTWSITGSNQYHVSYLNLDTGQNDSHLFWNRPINSLTLPRSQGTGLAPSPIAISNGQVYQDNGFSFDGGYLLPLYKDNFTPFKVVSLKSNGVQLAFKDETVRMIDPNLLSYDRVLWLKDGDQLFQLAGPESGEYVLGPNAIAWMESTGGVDHLLVRDLASGQMKPLTLEFPTFRLWDVNSQYVLVTTQVVPEPGGLALLAVAALAAAVRCRGRLGGPSS